MADQSPSRPPVVMPRHTRRLLEAASCKAVRRKVSQRVYQRRPEVRLRRNHQRRLQSRNLRRFQQDLAIHRLVATLSALAS